MNEHRPVQVRMMKQKARHHFLHDPALQCTVLQMEHAGNATTFFIFPNRGKLGQLAGALLPETLSQWDRLLRTRWAAHSSSGEADPGNLLGHPAVACSSLPALSPPGHCHPHPGRCPGPPCRCQGGPQEGTRDQESAGWF